MYYLVVGIEEGAEHLDAFFNLLHHFLHGAAVAHAGHGNLVDARHGAGARRYAVDAESASGKAGTQAAEKTYLVFGEDRYGE